MKASFFGRFLLNSAICLGLLISTWFVTVGEVSAHEYAGCTGLRWGGTAVTMNPGNSNFHADFNTAIAGARANFNTSDFDFVQSSYGPNQIGWFHLGSSDKTIAGAADVFRDCVNKRITSVKLYFNMAHFPFNDWHSLEAKQCVAIHEMAHAAGFDHNFDVSVLKNDHLARCHNQVIRTLQPHDINDINTKY